MSSARRTSDADVIEVSIRELDQLFDSLDPSPFRERGLDRVAHEYIVSIARELPLHTPTKLVVYLNKPVGSAEETQTLGGAIRDHFRHRAELLKGELRQLLHRGWMNLILGVTLLVSSVIVGQTVARRYGYGPLATVLRESLLIGGWVAMWRPMEILLYDYWELRAELRLLQRLAEVDVQIVYSRDAPASSASSAGSNHQKKVSHAAS